MTRARYKVVGFALALAGITYLDRVCISTLAPEIMRDLSLSKVQMSLVFSAFTLAYGIFEIPTAWYADKIGARKVLTRIVVWWSAFTVATAGVFNYPSLLLVRFLFGAGEAGAWPCAARTFAQWIPRSERGVVQGLFFGMAHLTGGLTPILITAFLTGVSWRIVFIGCGLIGFVWAHFWYRWFTDDPADHREVNKEELAHIQVGALGGAHGPETASVWRQVFGCSTVRALCVMYFSNVYGFYFLITWLPTYLSQQRGFSTGSLALFSGLPLILSVAADIGGGIATDRLTRRYGLRLGRAGICGISYTVAGIAIFGAAIVVQPVAAAILIAIAAAASMLTLAASWATCVDVGGPSAGVVSAAMNTAGQIGGFLSPIVLAFSVEYFSNWASPLFVMAGLYFASAICWIFIDPTTTVYKPLPQS